MTFYKQQHTYFCSVTNANTMIRTIIKIDENLCNGCGACVTGCHEGALQLINEKAVMISDLYCDGLGACIGECPVGAITFEKREAEPYSEAAVMERLIPKGEAVIMAHLNHLIEHEEYELLKQGFDYLAEHNINIGFPMESAKKGSSTTPCGCLSSTMQEIKRPVSNNFTMASHSATTQTSELRQFPVQLHLLNPKAGFLKGSNLLLAADCTAFASGEFHSRFLKGKSLAIACPKLDSNIPVYINKLIEMIDGAMIDTLSVLVMEVPCCGGLIRIAQTARQQANRNIPIKVVTLSVQGDIKNEEWI